MTPAEIQSEVMGFADNYASVVIATLESLQIDTTDPLLRLEIHEAKSEAIRNAYLIASGANPVVALLDMAAMVTLQRLAIDRFWIPDRIGDAGQPLLVAIGRLEDEIWDIARRVADEETLAVIQTEAQRVIDESPGVFLASRVRLSDLAAARTQQFARTQGGGNLLSLFYLDPLAGMSPASRELLQSRLLAERAFFYASRLPQAMNWELENVLLESLVLPEVQQLIRTVERAGDASAKIATLSQDLPALLNTEREAALNQAADIIAEEREQTVHQLLEGVRLEREAMFQELRDDNAELRGALRDLQSTLQTGTQLSESIEKTLGAADAMLARIMPAEQREGRPFDIREYQATLDSAAVTVEGIEQVTSSLQNLLESPAWTERESQFTEARIEAETGLDRFVDRLFVRGVLLIAIAILGGFGAAVLFRVVFRRAPAAN